MDRRISGALAWGALAVIIGVPAVDVLSRGGSEDAVAFETGRMPWASTGEDEAVTEDAVVPVESSDAESADAEVSEPSVSDVAEAPQESTPAQFPVPDYAAIPLPFRSVGDAEDTRIASQNDPAEEAQSDLAEIEAATPLENAEGDQDVQRSAVRSIDLNAVPGSGANSVSGPPPTLAPEAGSADDMQTAAVLPGEVIPFPAPASQRPEAPVYNPYGRDDLGYERDASGNVPSRYSRFEADVRDSIDNIRRNRQPLDGVQPGYQDYDGYGYEQDYGYQNDGYGNGGYDDGGRYDDYAPNAGYGSTGCDVPNAVQGIRPEGGVYVDNDGDGYPDAFIPCDDASGGYGYQGREPLPSSRFTNQNWQARSNDYQPGYDYYADDGGYPATVNGGTRLDLLQ